MKIYIEPTDQDTSELEHLCREKGWTIIELNRTLGRPSTMPDDESTVQKVLDTYYVTNSIRKTARAMDLNPGTVWRIVHRDNLRKGG